MQARSWGKSQQNRGLAGCLQLKNWIVHKPEGTGRSVKYVVYFSEVEVTKAFSSHSLKHQATATNEANSTSDASFPPTISAVEHSTTLPGKPFCPTLPPYSSSISHHVRTYVHTYERCLMNMGVKLDRQKYTTKHSNGRKV